MYHSPQRIQLYANTLLQITLLSAPTDFEVPRGNYTDHVVSEKR